jgi:hypothetical protein
MRANLKTGFLRYSLENEELPPNNRSDLSIAWESATFFESIPSPIWDGKPNRHVRGLIALFKTFGLLEELRPRSSLLGQPE